MIGDYWPASGTKTASEISTGPNPTLRLRLSVDESTWRETLTRRV
jgi:hypothetical protein